MTTLAALSRRLATVEARTGKASRPTTAFIIRAKDAADAKALLSRALDLDMVKRGDPVLLLTCVGMGESAWDDIAGLSVDDLAQVAEGGRYDPAIARMSDAELHGVIVETLPRVQ